MAMFASCPRCGKIHAHGKRCYSNGRNYYQADPKIRAFRNSAEWHAKTDEIRDRDKQLCAVCLANNRFIYKDLSVHHITPLSEDWGRRLDNDNLILVCDDCHKKAERGEIPRAELYKIIGAKENGI